MTNATLTAAACRDAFLSSGSSPTLYLLGCGSVGRALLRLLPSAYRLRGVSDSRATLWDQCGLDPAAVAAFKESHGSLAAHPRAGGILADRILALVDVDAVIDCTPTRERGFASGPHLWIHAAKHVDPARLEASGIHAVLGGTGLALQHDLPELRRSWRGAACVANATTTCVIEHVERGATFDEGIEAARQAGLVEEDANEDLDGTDAARKLAIVASLLTGTRRGAEEVVRPHLFELDPLALRTRRRSGCTTRLVGRVARDGALSLSYESLPKTATLAVPSRRVVYTYDLARGRTRVHLGAGLGPEGTARALLEDVDAWIGRRS